MLETGGDFGYVNWEASRWRLGALLTPRSYALNFGGFGATIRRKVFLRVAQRCKIALSKRICLRTIAACCVLSGVSCGVNFTLTSARHRCPRAVRFSSVGQVLPYAWVESLSC